MKEGHTLIQRDADFGTIRLQRFGARAYQTEIWAPDSGAWVAISSFADHAAAKRAFNDSLARLTRNKEAA